MEYEKGKKVTEGKTKIIWEASGNPDSVIIENKNDITAFDDPAFTKRFNTKAEYATTVTCRVFELLKQAGIGVAYHAQASSVEFVSPECRMIPLEVVIRRFAVGSYLKRHPELARAEGEQPYRFHRLAVELFLKTTRGELIGPKGEKLVTGLDPKKGEEDPFISNPFDNVWKLNHPKKPGWEAEADLERQVDAAAVLTENFEELVKKTDEIARKTFLTLEGAWNTLGYRLIDMKIELGIDVNGNLMVADVIDNDSWRLRDTNWRELSKEAFRQGEELDEVEKKYGFVAELVRRFRLPQQALVLWRGSESDAWPALSVFEDTGGVTVEKVTMSGHKQTRGCLDRLEELSGKYPDGGVIIAKVGRSNGLGPVLAARSAWPVIAVPATLDSFPDDAWSSLRMPSRVPLATAWPEANAVLLAAQILAQKNPVLYQKRQLMTEEYDS